MNSPKWHWCNKLPFNHPGVLARARNAFMGNGSCVNMFTMNQICFAFAVVSLKGFGQPKSYQRALFTNEYSLPIQVELKIKGVNISEKNNIVKLKEKTEELHKDLIKDVAELVHNKVLKSKEAPIPLGLATIIVGQEKVLDSIKLDPQFLESEQLEF